MTERKYGFVGRLTLKANHGLSSTGVSLFAAAGDYFGFLVRNLQMGELMLPVQMGKGFALIAENPTPLMAAFPARLGSPEGDWLNVFAECDITDPAHMPSTGGMMEAMPLDNVTFDGLFLPESQKAPFVVDEGGTRRGGKCYDRIEVCYRLPLDPAATPGMPSGTVSRGMSIGTGPVETQDRIITNVQYQPAAHSFGVIRIVDRAEMARMLAEDGLMGLDPGIDQCWSISYLRNNAEASRLSDINVGTVG